MEFGEKVKDLRKTKMRMSQTELANMIGVSLRTVRSWEIDGRRPRNRGVYARLAKALQCDEEYLLGESSVPRRAQLETLRDEGYRKADELVKSAKVLFAGGSLSEDDKDAVMLALQDAFVRSKKRRVEIFAPDFDGGAEPGNDE
ncbi:MAG: helix-turn-helix transcriptional regulator [Clostridia bacterium]|nr:helix-turn-helix transcriptional regulator [Clostridia bacterium]